MMINSVRFSPPRTNLHFSSAEIKSAEQILKEANGTFHSELVDLEIVEAAKAAYIRSGGNLGTLPDSDPGKQAAQKYHQILAIRL